AIPEALRPYAAEQLDAANPEAVHVNHAAHARYFTQFLAGYAAALRGGAQVAALAAIDNDLENVRAAWQWATAQADEPSLEAGTEALFRFYEMRSLFSEGAAAFAAIPETVSPLLRARALGRYGRFCQRLGQPEQAQQLLQQSLAIAHAQHAAVDAAFAHNSLGYTPWSQGEYALARTHYEESLRLYRKLDDASGCAQVLNNLAILPQAQIETAALLQESLHLTQQIGDLWGEARVLNNLGIVAANRDEAQARYEACVTICRAIGDRFLLTHPLINLGHERRRCGEFAAAHAFYAESLAICRDIGYQQGAERCLAHLAITAHNQGDDETAVHHSEQGLTVAQALGDQRGMGLLWYTLGVIALEGGDGETAVTHFQQSLDTFRLAGDSQGEAWPLLGLSRCALAQGALTAAQAQGQASLAIFRGVHDTMGAAQASLVLADRAMAAGDLATAQVYLQEVLDTVVT
ncbi:MAG: tetratricopeptide repeat protein, partial [Anaerolineales bacterium]|nr:tetratricopeptide repeat protein [Anaerolineales bacterium]